MLRPAHESPTPLFRFAAPALATAAFVLGDGLVYADAENGWIVPVLVALVGGALTIWGAHSRSRRQLAVRVALLVALLVVFQFVAFLIWASTVVWE